VNVFKTLGVSLIMGLLVSSHLVFGQIPTSGQQRIPQSIIINGQQVQGVMVVQNGTVQTYTCSSPQQYVTVDQSSSGWACFEETTGMWLLYAQPPPENTAPRAPTIVYSQPTPVYVPAPTTPPIYSYPYSYPTAIRTKATTRTTAIRFSSVRDLASASGSAQLSSSTDLS